jgi:WD40 repeat protein
LLRGAKDGGVFLWPLAASTNAVRKPDFIAGDWLPFGFSADEKALLVSSRRNGSLASIDLETGLTRPILNQTSSVSSRFGPFGFRACSSADGNVIARHVTDRQIEVWNRASDRRISLQSSRESVIASVVAPDGNAVVTISWGGAGSLYDLRDGSEFPLPAHGEHVLFTSDSKRILLIQRDGTVTICEAKTREIQRKFTLETPPGFGVALSPDDRILATAAAPDLSNTILLTDILTGKTIGTLSGHKQGVGAIAFSPDGKTLVSSSSDGSLKFWNVPTLQEILTFPIQGGGLVFSPHGQLLAFSARRNDADGIQVFRTAVPK